MYFHQRNVRWLGFARTGKLTTNWASSRVVLNLNDLEESCGGNFTSNETVPSVDLPSSLLVALHYKRVCEFVFFICYQHHIHDFF